MKNDISRRIGLNAFEIKIIIIILMTANHLSSLPGLLSPKTNLVFLYLSRCVAPMFGFLAAEGIRKTTNLKKYCTRLVLLAICMQIGNTAFSLITKNMMHFSGKLYLGNSIIGIACSVLAIYLLKETKKKNLCRVIAFILLISGFLYGEEGTVIVPIILIEYFFSERLIARIIGYLLTECIALLLPFGEPLFIVFIPLMLLYNGEEGKKTRFFYAYYPIHMWVIAAINLFIQ